MDERKNRQKVDAGSGRGHARRSRPVQDSAVQRFRIGGHHAQAREAKPGTHVGVPCPDCDGSGYIKSVQAVIGKILVEVQKIARAVEGDSVMLRVNPEVAKVLKSNQNSYLQEIEEILGRTVLVKSDPLLHQEKFDLAQPAGTARAAIQPDCAVDMSQ